MPLLVLIAVIIGAIRVWMGFNVAPEEMTQVDIYKDIAHLFVGGLIGAYFSMPYGEKKKLIKLLIIVLTVLETAVAVISRSV